MDVSHYDEALETMSFPLNLDSPADPPSADDVLNSFIDYVAQEGFELYDHQEEAILELFAGKNVILNTPTGSGKSLVALAMQYKSLCQGRRSYYTVPVKALANEKFLSLCKVFGPDQVGMITGDATVNSQASVICCTAEILSNLALREGSSAKVDDVIMDEFHYYSDHSRGVAWQIPLLTLPQSRFLLMSATLGDTERFERALAGLTGVETATVQSDQRPVPLEFDYSELLLEEEIAELVEEGKPPVYLVHFSQRACAISAQKLLSSNFCSREEKREIAVALQEANFGSPYGKEIAKLLRHGIGIHHAGLLPKYRVLIEKLTQRGLLKVVCGTDTLGVGVNVPIRTVVFTQLCKFDGKGTRILTVRDFKQICGRAGRRGFDTIGYVVAQAPEHVIENIRLGAKAATHQGKKSKFVKKKPPDRGFVAWDEAVFRKLIESPPETLVSSFEIQHSLLLNVLSRTSEDGCDALKRMIADCHESESAQRSIAKQAFQLFRSLVEADILEIIPIAQRTGPVKVQLNVDLQEDFSLNQALGLYLLEAIPLLDADSPTHSLELISLIEAILENPMVVLIKQVDVIKSELMADLKREGIEFEERLERLDEVEWPKPGKDFIYDTFNRFRAKHLWVGENNIRPKCIAREMFENYQSFDDYVRTYHLERSEGILLRYLSEVYKVLSQTIPPGLRTDEIEEAGIFLRDVVRSVDSSLIDEWEKLRDPNYVARSVRSDSSLDSDVCPIPITRNRRAFIRLLRNSAFSILRAFANKDFPSLLEAIQPEDSEGISWDEKRLREYSDAYLVGHERLRLDPEARSTKHTYISEEQTTWQVEQVLVDPADDNDWAIFLVVDLAVSDAAGTPVIRLDRIAAVGG
jgi:superfamily II DNA/RNA helicase